MKISPNGSATNSKGHGFICIIEETKKTTKFIYFVSVTVSLPRLTMQVLTQLRSPD